MWGPADGERAPSGVAKPAASLESEWANFEKLLAGSKFSTEEKDPSKDSIVSSSSSALRTAPKDAGEQVHPSKSRSQSRSKSRSRSKSSGSSSSSRSSSADSVKEIKDKKKSYSSSSSDEEGEKKVSTETPAAARATIRDKEAAPNRSPPVTVPARSATPTEAPRSRSRSRSRSVERRKSSDKSHRTKSRSRSRDRHGHSSRRRRRSKSRSRSRNREKGRHRGSRSKRHRRSRSRDRHRHSRRRKSRDRSTSRDRSRARDKRRRRGRRGGKHYRSRSRSRSRGHRSPHRDQGRYGRDEKFKGAGFRGADASKPTFKEKMRQQLLKASKMLTQQAQAGQLPPEGEKPLEVSKEKPSALPLNVTTAFQAATNVSTVTPQIALLQTMAVMHQKAQEMTGIAVPKYYNPAAVNPLKYAEQVQKRKLLWSKSKEKKEDTEAVWQATSFNSDQDGKVAAKFRKLMGMKPGEEAAEGEAEMGELHTTDKSRNTEDINRKQQELFQRLDREYEFARMTTHTHRGIGLGFQSQGLPDT